jgi:hypothetical protein
MIRSLVEDVFELASLSAIVLCVGVLARWVGTA